MRNPVEHFGLLNRRARRVMRFLVPFVSIAFTTITTAQDSPSGTMTFGSLTLQLGMTRNSALARLSETYQLNSSGMIITKEGPPFDLLGSIGFDDQGRVNYLSREWGPQDQQAGVETADALYNALTQLAKPTTAGRRTCACSVEIIETITPRGTARSMVISDASQRQIQMLVVRTQNPNPTIPSASVGVSETVRRR